MAERLLAEFPTEWAAAGAIRRLRDRGFRDIEAYTPFPSHEIEDALGKAPSRLPYCVFLVGVAAATAAYLLQWLFSAYLYPLLVGGRPPHFPLPFVIITFEMGILFAALTAFVGVLVLGRLVRLLDDVQGVPGFGSVTRDGFWVEVTVPRVSIDEVRPTKLLLDLGAKRIERPEPLP